MNHIDNLKVYEGFESVQLNLTPEKMQEYINEKLRTAKSDCLFIEKTVLSNEKPKIDVCEIGSGNSKLLYLMEQEGLINEKAVGYEVARSRFEMAEKMKAILGSSRVENRNKDFLDDDTHDQYDLVILVDLVFQMISPISDLHEQMTIKWIRDSLKRRGMVFFEIEDYSKEVPQNAEIRRWEQFSESDPFKYGLYSERNDDGIIEYEKVFISQDMKESKQKTFYKTYTKEEITNLLETNGFETEVYDIYNTPEEKQEDIDNGIFREGVFRILAQKK